MPSLREFIPTRHREIAAEVAEALARVRDLNKELEDLRLAAESVGIELVSEQTAEAAALSASEQNAEQRGREDETIKEAVMSVVHEAGHGMMASDILLAINTRLNTEYPRTSLSPQLSRLKQEGQLDLEDNIWLLKRGSDAGTDSHDVQPGPTQSARKTNKWIGVLRYIVDEYPSVMTNNDLVKWGNQNSHSFSRHQLRAALFNWRKQGYVEAVSEGQHRATRSGAEAAGRLIEFETKEGSAIRPNPL